MFIFLILGYGLRAGYDSLNQEQQVKQRLYQKNYLQSRLMQNYDWLENSEFKTKDTYKCFEMMSYILSIDFCVK